jgi:hypothetical protein
VRSAMPVQHGRSGRLCQLGGGGVCLSVCLSVCLVCSWGGAIVFVWLTLERGAEVGAIAAERDRLRPEVDAHADHVPRLPALAVGAGGDAPLLHALAVVGVRVGRVAYTLLVGEAAVQGRPAQLHDAAAR